MSVNDKELLDIIDKCRYGVEVSQTKLFTKYKPIATSIVSRYFKDSDTICEVVQEGFIKVFSNLHKFEDTGSFDGWFSKVIRNVSIDKTRKQVYNEEFSEKYMDPPDDDLILIKEERVRDIMSETKKLSRMYALVFKMYYIENMKHREIADELNIAIGTSKSNLHKARKQIISNLKNKNYN